jgi:hypothetical protein
MTLDNTVNINLSAGLEWNLKHCYQKQRLTLATRLVTSAMLVSGTARKSYSGSCTARVAGRGGQRGGIAAASISEKRVLGIF